MWLKFKKWLTNLWQKFRKWFIGILIALGIVAAPIVLSAPQDFSWSNPTTRVDGSAFDPATEQAETRIYCDGDTTPTIVVPGDATTATGDFSFGSHTCYATVVDNFDQESDASNSVTFVVTPARPNPPVFDVR